MLFPDRMHSYFTFRLIASLTGHEYCFVNRERGRSNDNARPIPGSENRKLKCDVDDYDIPCYFPFCAINRLQISLSRMDYNDLLFWRLFL